MTDKEWQTLLIICLLVIVAALGVLVFYGFGWQAALGFAVALYVLNKLLEWGTS